MPRVISLQEAARRTGVDRRTIAKLIHDRKLAIERDPVTGARGIDPDTLYVVTGGPPPKPPPSPKPPPPPRPPKPPQPPPDPQPEQWIPGAVEMAALIRFDDRGRALRIAELVSQHPRLRSWFRDNPLPPVFHRPAPEPPPPEPEPPPATPVPPRAERQPYQPPPVFHSPPVTPQAHSEPPAAKWKRLVVLAIVVALLWPGFRLLSRWSVGPGLQPGPQTSTSPGARCSLDPARVTAFVQQYFANGNAANVQSVTSIVQAAYADRVEFYGVMLSRPEVITKKVEYLQRWPIHRFVPQASIEAHCNQATGIYDFTGKADYVVSDPARNASGNGIVLVHLGIAVQPSGTMKIVQEGGGVTQRNLTRLR